MTDFADHANKNPSSPADSNRPVTIAFEDRTITAEAGQSIAAALFAAGVRVFGRSFKYHRPRGLLCCSGDCPNCLMQVDGRPNVRTCIEPARDGQVVSRQNAWPSADFDALRVFDSLDRFLPVGFYYKQFHKPRWLWPIFEHAVRHIAGLGRIDVNRAPETTSSVEHLHADVCVVGAGPAGIAAAATAAQAGARVILVERENKPGGHLNYERGSLREVDTESHALSECRHASVLYNTTAFGLYEGNLLGAFQSDRLLKIRAKQIIVCTGGRERPFLFHNNDLPGIMLGRGTLRLARLHDVRAGRCAVVLTDCDRGELLAAELVALGIEVAAVVDTRTHAAPRNDAASWKRFPSSVVLAALGRSQLRAVSIARLDQSGAVRDEGIRVRCDLLCMASELVPANELLLQAGIRFRNHGTEWAPDRELPGLRVAGAAAGTIELQSQIVDGQRCGAEAAAATGCSVRQLEELRHAWSDQQAKRRANAAAPTSRSPSATFGTATQIGTKRFVCLCEDVTEKDLDQAIAEGFDNVETLKRYSTANMGPCQGKMCGLAAAEICARAAGRDVNAVGLTTSRPPAVPVEMCVLAAAADHPIRRTPLHHWHESAGATWMDAGQWKRPESYGDSAAEVLAVRGGVGLIDVSTLGKIEVVGPDAAELLDRVYLNKWSDLKPGRVRYGVMCNEDGIVFDDGVGTRLAPDRFYLTATTGNAEGVLQWLELWRATWGLDASILNHTSGVAAMNIAGPRSREVLGRLTSLDISPAAFPYMTMREAEVVGVPCRLFRIGFVGELGYEIHCPAALAWHVWESLLGAGRKFNLRPFGVEAQRILRLEKGHIIIGADTDALSNPLEAGLEWLVRFDKPDFIGRAPLVRLKERGPRSRLVGFVVPDSKQAMPEGSQIVENGYPVGRITSARVSPTVGQSLGLAWLPSTNSAVGSRFQIRWNGADVEAVVAQLPFYDPLGERLKM